MAVLYSGSYSQWRVSSTRTCRMYGQCLCNGVKRCIAESVYIAHIMFSVAACGKIKQKRMFDNRWIMDDSDCSI